MSCRGSLRTGLGQIRSKLYNFSPNARCLGSLETPTLVTSLTVSSNGKYVVTGSRSGVTVYDIEG